MIRVSIPGWRTLELIHLVVDLNGTIALDGQVLPGVGEQLASLATLLAIHLVTADTQGQAGQTAERLGLHLSRIESGGESEQKLSLVMRLGPDQTVVIGNGANDAAMLAEAGLGIAVLGPEGLATPALQAADLIVVRIEDALGLLLRTERLVATLRR